MASKTEERIEALQIALNNELREKEFYLKHAERTGNSLGKLMFATIASDEDEHYQRILNLHKRLKTEGKWPETLPIQVKGTEVKDILKNFVNAVDASVKSDDDDRSAVKIALDFETKGEMFYSDLAKKVDNPMEKKFYQFLASIEREHRLSLQDTLEFFEDPAGWYQTKEKGHLDGG